MNSHIKRVEWPAGENINIFKERILKIVGINNFMVYDYDRKLVILKDDMDFKQIYTLVKAPAVTKNKRRINSNRRSY